MPRFRLFFITALSLCLITACGAESARAAVTTLPGPADLNRLQPDQSIPAPLPAVPAQNSPLPHAPLSAEPAPEQARNIHFVLRDVVFKHVTVFTPEQLRDLYRPYVGKDVTLDVAWKIAAALTERYRQEGYFLSRAFVPAQKIARGIHRIQIDAVEGYIGAVSVAGDAPASSLIDSAVAAIKAGRPARIQTLERQILLLNDLPGLAFQATLEPIKNQNEPAVCLVLTVKKTPAVTTLGADNGGSRYIGPYETSATWSGSLLPLQQTDLSLQYTPALSSASGRLYALNGTQRVPLSTSTSLEVTAGYSNAVPGYTLKPDNITSQAVNGGIGLSYDLVRQRDKSLTTRFSVDFRNSASDILDTVLSRDRIRAGNIGINYDAADFWFGNSYPGHSNLDLALRQGLPVFNSNPADDPAASRPGTTPDFTKLTATYNRQQSLASDYIAALTLSGQKAARSLYSSEEFGYGGMAVGRAYDTSEISGDSGISASLEARYQGLHPVHQTTLVPYLFYDIGKVWSYSTGQPEQISAASAGPGVRVQFTQGLSANLYAAKPLTKTVNTPLYGQNDTAPRFVFQISDKF